MTMLEALSRLGVHLPSLLIYTVNFLALWGILYLVAFKPFARRIRQRQQEEEAWQVELERVDQLMKEAEDAKVSALVEARVERDALLRAAADLGETYVRDGIKRSRKAALAQLKQAREEVRRQSSRAYQDLHDSFVELVLGAAERALGRSLNEEVNHKLIDEASHELSQVKWELPVTRPIGFATVTTAVPMTDEQKKEISEFLERTARRRIRTIYRVDQSVIGGVQVLTGDTLMDATLKNRLDRLRHHLLSETPRI